MKNPAKCFLIFCLNAFFTYVYIYFVIGTFDVQVLWDSKAGDWGTFLPDIMQYNLAGAEAVGFEDALFRLALGSTWLHAVILGAFFESKTLYSGIIVNSVFVAITFGLFYRKNAHHVFTYILLAPFFVFYSVGWTKEIIFTLALAFFLRSIQVDSKINLFLSFFVSLVSKPQFTPLLMIALLSKKISNRKFVVSTLLIMAVAPIWLALIPVAYTSAAEDFYSHVGGQGISKYTDYLKTSVPFLSIIGYVVAFFKLYFEPLSGLIVDAANIYAGIEFYVQIIFFYILIRSRFRLFDNKLIFNLFILFNVFICSLPFTHFRYLMPLLVVLIIFSTTVTPFRANNKTNSVGELTTSQPDALP